jgi:probable ATP-dependent RNA helicase DDX4
VACAQTGSGKTAAFLLPIISNLLEYHADELAEKNHPPAPLCLIVSPTRELALQTEREARKFAYQTAVIPCSAIGGHDMFAVTDRLREGCHILSATTGRLKDMVEKGRVSLKKVKYFVLDEADRMLDTGFEPDIRKLLELGLPSKDERFTSMFSATFPDEVQQLAKHFLRDNYIFLAVGTPGGANEDITQTIEEVPQANKKDRLFQLLEQNLKSERCLIFVETKRSADYIGSLLSQKKLMSTTMHGDRTQKQRNEAVQQFTNGKCPILVATSVAARGLDFPLIGYVVNYDLPDSSDFYIHRIGRTGRAGHLGKSISFFDPDRDSDRKIAPDLIAKLTEAGQDVPEFLKKFTDGANAGFTRGGGGGGGGFGSRNADMRSGANNFGTRNQQTAGPSGGSASAGGATAEEEWD